MVLLPIVALSQELNTRYIRFDGGQAPNRADLLCPENSMFSQLFAGNAAYTSDQDYGYIVYDNYSVSGGFNTITFWGMIFSFNTFSDCSDNPMDFRITFYQDNGGAIGAVDSFFDVTILGEFAYNWGGWSFYEFTADLGTTMNLNNGWVSIEGTSTGDFCVFLWGNSVDGDLNAYQAGTGWFAEDLAYCLSMSGVVPVSNWAVIIAIGLIVSFVVLRFKKIL